MKTEAMQGGAESVTTTGEMNQKGPLLIGVLVLILAVAGGLSWWKASTKTKAMEASDALFQAVKQLQADEARINPAPQSASPDAASPAAKIVDVDAEMPATVAALKGVWEKFPSGQAANQARSELASLYLKNGQAAKAVPLYEQAAKHANKGLDRAISYYALAMAQDGAGKKDEAIKSLQTALEQKNSGLEAEMLLSLARIQKQKGSQADAQATVDRLKKDFPNTTQAKSAELLTQ